MNRITTPSGVTVSYDKYGSGPPLVLVHGAFSDHDTNWEFVKPMFRERLPLETLAAAGRWGDFAMSFFRDVLSVPVGVPEELRATELWPPIVADAPASLGDLRAVSRYVFKPERFSQLELPVLLQIGSESPRSLYATDALAAVLPNARIEELPGQAHEGMTTAPEMYARSVVDFLLG